MKNKKPLVIDFVGSSCSGKTYVKSEVLKRLSANHRCLDLSDDRMASKDCFIFFFTEPGACIASLLFVLFSLPRSYKAGLKLLKKWFTVQIKIKKSSVTDVDFALLDEGFFKWLANIRGHSLRKLTFEKIPVSIKRNFFYPDLTILVEADFDTVQLRKTSRGLCPEAKEKKSLERFAKNQNNLRKDLLAAEKSGFLRVIPYDNNGDFDASLLDKIFHLTCKKI